MDFFNERKKDILIIILIVIIIGLGVVIVSSINKDNECVNENVVIEKKEEVIEVDNDEDEVILYYVDIKGAVKKPGVYQVSKGSIVNEKTTTNMIQKINPIFTVNPLISKGI